MNARLPKLTPVHVMLALFTFLGWASRAESATTYDLGAPSPAGITTVSGTVTLPISINGFTPSGAGARAFRVSIKLSAGLKFSPNAAGAVTPGAFMTNTDPTAFVIPSGPNADGSFTFD